MSDTIRIRTCSSNDYTINKDADKLIDSTIAKAATIITGNPFEFDYRVVGNRFFNDVVYALVNTRIFDKKHTEYSDCILRKQNFSIPGSYCLFVEEKLLIGSDSDPFNDAHYTWVKKNNNLVEGGFGYLCDLLERLFDSYIQNIDSFNKTKAEEQLVHFLKSYFNGEIDKIDNVDENIIDEEILKTLCSKTYSEIEENTKVITQEEARKTVVKKQYKELIKSSLKEKIEKGEFEYVRDFLDLINTSKKLSPEEKPYNSDNDIARTWEGSELAGESVAYLMSKVTGLKYEYTVRMKDNCFGAIKVPEIEAINIDNNKTKNDDWNGLIQLLSYRFLPFWKYEKDKLSELIQNTDLAFFASLIKELPEPPTLKGTLKAEDSINLVKKYLVAYFKKQLYEIDYTTLNGKITKKINSISIATYINANVKFDASPESVKDSYNRYNFDNLCDNLTLMLEMGEFDYVRDALEVINKYNQFLKKYAKQEDSKGDDFGVKVYRKVFPAK